MKASESNELEDALTACLAAMLDGDADAFRRVFDSAGAMRAALRSKLAELARLDLLPQHQPSPGVPSPLGDFDLLANLGGGGMGLVFLARQRSLKRAAAVKLLRPEMAGLEQARERFRREAAAIARLAHPSIVPVLAFGEENGVLYLAMEFLPGLTLAEVLRALDGRAPESLDGNELRFGAGPETARGGYVEGCVAIAHSIALALQHAHERGVLHRDVKPSNILLTPSGRPVLIDFGLARAEGERQLTSAMSMVGSLLYASPEQLRGSELDARSDVYSLGAVLYEMLALVPPFSGTHELSLRSRILAGTIVPLRQRNRSVSSDVEAVVMTAMDPEPKRRYASANDLASDLANILALRPVKARPLGRIAMALRFARREKALALALVLAFLLVTVMPSTLYLIQRRAEWDLSESVERTKAALADVERERDAKDDALKALQRKVDLESLARLTTRADALWPATPERVTADDGMDTWIAEAESTLARLRTNGETARPVALFERTVEEVKARREWVLDLGTRFTAARDSWVGVKEALTSTPEVPGYAGIELAPQFGLEPLGADPRSHFLEFAVLHTGTPPTRDVAGDLVMDEGSALVLVLLPGGAFSMGAQRPDAEHPLGSPNVDPNADEAEGPVHSVTLAPFFVSKYEMTVGQWRRLLGLGSRGRRSEGRLAGASRAAFPIEQIDHPEARRVLKRAGLDLPTEAQWEFAARGGTTTIWWCGDESGCLAGKANLADQAFGRANGNDVPFEHAFDDGLEGIGPVGRFPPNPFGLHDVGGNVREWCLDVFGPYSIPVREGDGLRVVTDVREFVARDGNFAAVAALAKSAARTHNDPSHRASRLGVRPARRID